VLPTVAINSDEPKSIRPIRALRRVPWIPSPVSAPPLTTGAAVSRAFRRRRAALVTAGRWQARYVDPAPARVHLVETLQAQRISLETAALLCGVGAATLSALMYPGHPRYGARLHVETADAILRLAVDLDRLPDGALVTSVGTARRLEALAAIGWPLAMLDEFLGLPVNTLAQWRRPRRVTGSHARVGPGLPSVSCAANWGDLETRLNGPVRERQQTPDHADERASWGR